MENVAGQRETRAESKEDDAMTTPTHPERQEILASIDADIRTLERLISAIHKQRVHFREHGCYAEGNTCSPAAKAVLRVIAEGWL